jgi:sugar O-acyltransferase (sialic acid O-acetyltransferase NeuD family)
MTKKYYIIGSGGFAKEVYFLAEQCLDKSIIFSGFIDFEPKFRSLVVRQKEENVIDEMYFLENIKPSSDIQIYLGIGDPKLIEKLSIKFQNYLFPNLIHPNFVGDIKSIHFGIGNIITAGCVFTVDIKVGSFNIFNLHTTIGHDCVIENFNVFNPGANISGGVNISSANLFGTNCTVLQMLKIGKNNIIGAASLANKNIDDGCVMVGVPAKNIMTS